MNRTAPGTRPDWLTRELLPYESHFVEIGEHVIHYIDEGQGPTLLMLHGNPTWSFLYRHLVSLLRDRFRCIAPDYPGFGLSVAAEGYDFLPESHAHVIGRLVERLGLTQWIPVMQDWGGPIGLDVAERMPEQVAGLVIGNTWAWPVQDDPHFVRFSRVMGGPIGRLAIRRANAFVNVMIPLGTRRRRLGRAPMRAYRKPLDTPGRREPSYVFPREIVGSAAFLERVASGLGALAGKPTLICWGDADIAFRSQERARFERLFPRSTSVTLRGAGHYIQEEAPEEIAGAIASWWARESRAGG